MTRAQVAGPPGARGAFPGLSPLPSPPLPCTGAEPLQPWPGAPRPPQAPRKQQGWLPLPHQTRPQYRTRGGQPAKLQGMGPGVGETSPTRCLKQLINLSETDESVSCPGTKPGPAALPGSPAWGVRESQKGAGWAAGSILRARPPAPPPPRSDRPASKSQPRTCQLPCRPGAEHGPHRSCR